MEQSNLITFSKTIKKVFSKKRLNKLGKQIGLSKRERKITPERLLSQNAARSHPKRDRRSGRMQLGLQPVFAVLKD